MERDFMGLNSGDFVAFVKEEAVEGSLDRVISNCSAGQWPTSNKARTNGDAFEPGHKLHTDEIQNGLSLRLPHNVKICTVSNQGVPFSMNNLFPKSQFAVSGQNFAGASLKPEFLAGAPIAATHGVLSNASITRTTERSNAKGSAPSAQLTIFYGGTVNVYNDISLEKAQAIMFLAGNVSAASSMTQPMAPIHIPNSKQAAGDGAFVSQPVIATSCSGGISSPMSVSSHPAVQLGCGLGNNEEMIVAKANAMTNAPSNLEPSKMVTPVGSVSVSPNTMITSAVPLARKASLARFLEKRKERVMNLSPYNLSKKSPECSTPDSTGISFSATSGVSSASLGQVKE